MGFGLGGAEFYPAQYPPHALIPPPPRNAIWAGRRGGEALVPASLRSSSGGLYLATASYIFKERPSLIFRWDPGAAQFVPFQEITACAPHDVEFGYIGGALFLFFSEDRNGKNSTITSQVRGALLRVGQGRRSGAVHRLFTCF